MTEYCWCVRNKEKFEIVSKDLGSNRITIKRIDGAVKIKMSMNDFTERFKLFRPLASIFAPSSAIAKCECGVDKAYGPNVPKSWHSDWCPKSK